MAAAFLIFQIAGEIVGNEDMHPVVWLVTGTALATVPLAWRRRSPAVVAILCGLGLLLTYSTAQGEFPPQLTFVPPLIALYTAANRTRGVEYSITGVITLLLTVAAHVASVDGDIGDFWPWLLWGGAWLTGTWVRRRTELAAHLARRAALLEVEVLTAAAESAERERNRIARELHDVIAHSVSVMVVQAGAERMRLGGDMKRTGSVLDAIENSGRMALAELRTMLSVLHDPDVSGGDTGPLLGLPDILGLVDRLRATGLDIDLDLDPPDLLDRQVGADSNTQLAVYRVVQEALTNVIRHAGMVGCSVRLAAVGEGLSVTISSHMPHGPPPEPNLRGSGRGLAGMRERVHALGGSFDAGLDSGGFVVRAVFPIPVRQEAG
jgi:signal transduction histidine kinase